VTGAVGLAGVPLPGNLPVILGLVYPPRGPAAGQVGERVLPPFPEAGYPLVRPSGVPLMRA
jgi:hypothetical protein